MSAGIAVAALVGIGIGLQVAILGRSSAEVNPLSVSLALQLGGVIGASLWATSRAEWSEVLDVVTRPWWLPLGVGGWIVVAALGYSSDRVGVATTLAVSIAAQATVGLAIDSTLGMRTIGVAPIVGTSMILIGVTVIAVTA